MHTVHGRNGDPIVQYLFSMFGMNEFESIKYILGQSGEYVVDRIHSCFLIVDFCLYVILLDHTEANT